MRITNDNCARKLVNQEHSRPSDRAFIDTHIFDSEFYLNVASDIKKKMHILDQISYTST